MNAGLYWVPSLMRFMTVGEKLAALGMPVQADFARGMGVPQLVIRDEARASAILGNCWNFVQGTVVQMIALACFAEQRNAIAP